MAQEAAATKPKVLAIRFGRMVIVGGQHVSGITADANTSLELVRDGVVVRRKGTKKANLVPFTACDNVEFDES